MSATPDPCGTAAIRAATLAAWTGSPTRLREDANLEDDHARGYYRDRAVVELAQNAADAARAQSSRDGGPPAGCLLLRLTDDGGGPLLIAANTGAPLTPAGVQALASMRASAKPSDGSGHDVGRFGVGFAAVRAVSDEIVIASRGGGVAFSAARVRDLLAAAGAERASAEQAEADRPATDRIEVDTHAATAEAAIRQALERPAADLPILRLPFPVGPDEARVPPGYDTAVVARLRSPQDRTNVERLLGEVDDALLLALPALAEVRIEVDDAEPRVLEDVSERWLTVRKSGRHDATHVADRPHEERTRTAWSITWALPRVLTPSRATPPANLAPAAPAARDNGAHVVHAPTPTDEPCTLPALLVATFPLDPSRRHVAPGPATDALVSVAGEAYADLVALAAADGADALPLVPAGLPGGHLDAALHAAALTALRRAPILTQVGATPEAPLISPREARTIAGPAGHDAAALRTLARAVPGLVAAPGRTDAQARLRALGVETLDLADVIDAIPAALALSDLRALDDALAPLATDPAVREALAGLPVPLVDGRTVRGPRGVVVVLGHHLSLAAHEAPRRVDPDGSSGAALGEGGTARPGLGVFGPFGLRVAHPGAAHPLLVQLGAVEATPRSLLGHPAVRAAVAAATEGDGGTARTRAVGDAILALVAAALADGVAPREIAAASPWLGGLPLEDDGGDLTPARDLALPGSWAAEHLDGLRLAAAALPEEHSPETLCAVGVRAGLVTVTVADVVAEQTLSGPDPDDGGPEAFLDGWPDYLDHLAEVLGPGTYVGEVTAVADLDAVAETAWPAALRRLAADPQGAGSPGHAPPRRGSCRAVVHRVVAARGVRRPVRGARRAGPVPPVRTTRTDRRRRSRARRGGHAGGRCGRRPGEPRPRRVVALPRGAPAGGSRDPAGRCPHHLARARLPRPDTLPSPAERGVVGLRRR